MAQIMYNIRGEQKYQSCGYGSDTLKFEI